jgi:dipeptidyl-peptidase-4
VDKVLGLDETHVYYMGTSPGMWLESHMFRVKLNGEGTPECLTGAVPGMHSCVLNLKTRLYVDSVSTVDRPTVVAVYKLPNAEETIDGTNPAEQLLQLHDAGEDDDRVPALALKPPSFHTFPSTDGAVTLQAAVYLPDEEVHGKGPWPLVVATYGGPHVQYVQNTWGMMTADLRSQFLRANGFAVIKVDNRGSNRRGLVFEAPIYGNMGAIEVEDQVAGVEWAVHQGIARRNQVAVSGWSYGGYMALKCLAGRPDVFHAAVSGAPVTDWTLYDTAYTERYMGLPQENPDGYAKSSALSDVRNIDGSLLLCHGLLDENVLFRHSAVLVNALIEEQKAYDLALFPSERHGPRREQDRAFLEERILAFLQRSLGV